MMGLDRPYSVSCVHLDEGIVGEGFAALIARVEVVVCEQEIVEVENYVN